MTTTPTIAITMGDPAGIGPEVIAKALSAPQLRGRAALFVVGDARVIRQALALVGSDLPVRAIADPSEADPSGASVEVLDCATRIRPTSRWARSPRSPGALRWRRSRSRPSWRWPGASPPS